MVETTLSVDESTVERLEQFRDPSYGSWDRTLNGLMNMVPTVDEINDGCSWCDEDRISNVPVDERGGVVQYALLSYPGGEEYHTDYFCSLECARSQEEEISSQFPEEPDLVRVGGRGHPISETEDANFYIDGEAREVVFPIPNAFDGYEEEPVYIQNNSQWVQKGIVEEIFQEDANTTILLGHDTIVESLNHPENDTVQAWQNDENRDAEVDCEECGRSAAYTLERPDKCPFCAAEL